VGGAFGMGAVGGGLWHLLKGMKNSPGGARFKGGIEVGCGLKDTELWV
jgi:import inner membrane translocase subunit TIM17